MTATTISTCNFDEFQTLTRMTTRDEPFVATIARATLAIVEARRDAEIRAATSESALEAAQERFAGIRDVLSAVSESGLDQARLSAGSHLLRHKQAGRAWSANAYNSTKRHGPS